MSAEIERWRKLRMSEMAEFPWEAKRAGDALASALEEANALIARMGPSEAAAIDRVEELEAGLRDARTLLMEASMCADDAGHAVFSLELSEGHDRVVDLLERP